MKIKDIRGREILNSGATTSIEVKIFLEDGTEEQASVPFGASVGSHEAFVLFDQDKRYCGKGMLKAVQNINTEIKRVLIGQDAYNQTVIDQIMIDLDGTENKYRLGSNAILGVSLAIARAAAKSQKLELYEYISQIANCELRIANLPLPMIVLIEGGRHADDSTDFQEYLIVPQVSESATENIRCGAEVYLALKLVLKEKGYNTNVGNEGAYAPQGIKTNEEPWELILQAIKKAGYKAGSPASLAGKEVMLAADPACSEIAVAKQIPRYKFPACHRLPPALLRNAKRAGRRRRMAGRQDTNKSQIPNPNFQYQLKKEQKILSSEEMIDYFAKWVEKYPFISLEDILAEDDWTGWEKATARLGQKIRIIGDDLLVTNPKRLERAIKEKSCNGILIKLNQIGTLTETVKTMQMAHQAGFWTIVSQRGGGETNDASMIDLAVACGSKMAKVGIARGERVCKYNRLMEIEEQLKI